MKVLIIDDDQNFIEKISKDLDAVLHKYENDVRIHTYQKYNPIIFEENYDLIILDIMIGSNNGIDIAKMISNLSSSFIVFASNFNHLVFDAIKVKPLYFLRKKEYYEDLYSLIDILDKEVDGRYYLETCYKYVKRKIKTSDIIYMVTKDHSISIYTRKDIYKDNRSLRELTEALSTRKFVRINKSTILNLDYVDYIDKDEIYLNQDCLKEKYKSRFYVSTVYCEDFGKIYQEYLVL